MTDDADNSGPGGAVTPSTGDRINGPGLARLLAGGRHVRLLIAGRPPAGVHVPPCDAFERVVQVVRSGQIGPVVVDALRLPFHEALFDKALVTTPLLRLSAKAELREIWRVLAPAGLALFIVKARRPWQVAGWSRDELEVAFDDAMFEVLDWRVETVPDRWHLVLVGKRDGLRPAMIGRVDAVETVAVRGV